LLTAMGNRFLPTVLAIILVVLQAQLWLGRGSIRAVAELERKVQDQKQANDKARLVNEQLSAEINDLKEGLNMVEERARNELGMVKPNEIYVQIAK
jgi:cell division protein FtsB